MLPIDNLDITKKENMKQILQKKINTDVTETIIGDWLDNQVRFNAESTLYMKDIYHNYTSYTLAKEQVPLGKKTFVTRLKKSLSDKVAC